jgi:signal transduction histidine kinase
VTPPARRPPRTAPLRPLFFLALAVATAAVQAATTPGRKPTDAAQVLVITGTDPYLPAFVAIDAAMRGTVAKHRQAPVNWLYESLDTLRFSSRPDQQLAEVLARKYDGVRIDAIVLVTEPAVEFYLRHGARYWPDTPAVYNFVAAQYARQLPVDARLTGVPAEVDFAQTLRIALSLQPAARRALVIAGSAPWDQTLLAGARRALAAHADHLTVEVLSGQAPDAVAARLAQQSPDTIVLYVGLLADASGMAYVPRDVLARLSAVSPAPIYGPFESYMGSGIAAGAVESFHARGERMSALVLRAIDAGAASLPAEPLPSHCVADARQLKRFGLDPRRLPAGCEVRFVELTFLQRYWWQSLLVALALVGQTLLIVSLLLQGRRRRAAELNLAAHRVQLLHASRLAVAGELTASIAHEINQPLGAILSNADAAEMLVQSGQIQREELLQILADIRRDDLRASEVIKRLRTLLARHEVERRRFSLNKAVEDAAAILRAETRRRDATVDYAMDARRADVMGDPVQIQQVIINLILNAFDAGAGLPSERRRVRVETSDTPRGVQLTVRDSGAGIATGDLPRLFDPFFSTKSSGMGLGLSIVRSIVEAHGGTITAASNAIGAEFSVTLPVAPSTDPAEQPVLDTP